MEEANANSFMQRQSTIGKDPALQMVVEQLTEKEKDAKDFFVTQRGGKLASHRVVVDANNDFTNDHSRISGQRRTLQSTILLQKKKEMQQVQEELERKRAEFTKRMEECREKREALKLKQKQIRDRVLKFEKFLRENDAKRHRANAKTQAERKIREQKEREFEELKKVQKKEAKSVERMKLLIRKYRPYETYLMKVVESLPTEYIDVQEPQISDLLMRYSTLVETNHDLTDTLQNYNDQIAQLQNDMSNLLKTKNDRILVFNSELGTFQKKVDKRKQETSALEQRLEEREKLANLHLRTLGEAKLSIDNLFNRVNGSLKKTQTVHSTSLTRKLQAVQDRILDLTQIAAKSESVSAQEKAKRILSQKVGSASLVKLSELAHTQSKMPMIEVSNE